MAGEETDIQHPASVAADPEARRNERSSILFPYLDLDTAVEVARAVFNRGGHGSCQLDELAAEMRQTVSGAFRLKTGTARIFGLTQSGAGSGIMLTPLGVRAVNAASEAIARVDAFLNVPLYSAIYEKYKGHLLPPAKALEREMVALGVAPKQADKARQVFDRSARQAGFHAEGEDRLVRPRTSTPNSAPATTAHTPMPTPATRSLGSGGGSVNEDGASKPLEYLLIDLLDPSLMKDDEQQAVWTLLNYLKRKKQTASAKPIKEPVGQNKAEPSH